MTLWPGTPDGLLTVSGHAGAKLHMERFSPASGESTTSLIFLHGIGAYAGPLRRFARDLADHGISAYLPDLRGHGRSGVLRGEMGSPGEVLADIASMVEHVRAEHPGGEVVLGGESMGGLIALAYAASTQSPPDRLILLAPALRARWKNAPFFSKNKAPRPLPGDRLPGTGFALHGPVPAETIRDHAFRNANLADPTLLIHGDHDSVLYADATEVLHRKLAHSEMHVIEGAWHNILWDPTREATTDIILEWLLRPRS